MYNAESVIHNCYRRGVEANLHHWRLTYCTPSP